MSAAQDRVPTVVIAGGGVAALEAALALESMGRGRVRTVLLTSSDEYVMRAAAVREPFTFPAAHRYPIADVLGGTATWIRENLAAVDPAAKVVTTHTGSRLDYDRLIIASGARASATHPHAITIDDRRLDELLHGMIQDIEADAIHRVAYVAPERAAWPLPLYELALMTAERASDMGAELDTLLATPEDQPLEVFGAAASKGIRGLLISHHVELHTSSYAEVPSQREIVLLPGQRRYSVDRVIALPELYGPEIPGLEHDAEGFLPVDEFCRVDGAAHVYAAGDCANQSIKHGGVAAQMAVTAARAIAADFCDEVKAAPLDLELRGLLHTGLGARYLSAHRVGGHPYDSRFSTTPLWDPPAKVSTAFLGERLGQLAHASGRH
ncbi:MAG: FAD-dependent oxidoreductase [Solirubrobacteraceae bacterium]|nr:FAD-dependent oxidoreductase [Solirubrobacteraceae bacterium]